MDKSIALRKFATPIRLGLVFFVMALCALAVAPANADHRDVFIPDHLRLFQPIDGDPRGINAFSRLTRGLDNQALEQTAANLRSNRMSATQRALNDQWLEQHHTGEMSRSSKVLTRFLRSVVKSYWNEWRRKNLSDDSAVPDASGRGKINYGGRSFDYKLRVSRDEVKFKIKYEF